VNGITQLALTKLDILSGLNKIPLCEAYHRGEEEFRDLPLGVTHLDAFQPVFENLSGWEDDLREIRTWEQLPEAARDYIFAIQRLSGLPVTWISVGPERDQVIHHPSS
jgi:adenylosuccinate synthase